MFTDFRRLTHKIGKASDQPQCDDRDEGIPPKSANRLTTRRLSAVGVDLVPAGSISPQSATVAPTDLAQAATNGVEGRMELRGLSAR